MEIAILFPMKQTSGELIREARLDRLWTQQDLAYHSGLSYKTISLAENDMGVKLRTLKTIADALGIDLPELHQEASA